MHININLNYLQDHVENNATIKNYILSKLRVAHNN